MAKQFRSEIKKDLTEIFRFLRPIEHHDPIIESFQCEAINFWDKYKVDSRELQLTSEQKQSLLTSQEGKCAICQGALYIGDEIDVDHTNPLALGGKDEMNNLQLAHSHCNKRKQAKKLK